MGRYALGAERVAQSTGTATGLTCVEETMGAVEAGVITPTAPVISAAPVVPITPRYATPERHGDSAPNVRLTFRIRASG